MTSEAPAETRPGAECSRDVPFVAGPVSIGVQSVLYGNNAAQVRRAIASLARAAELAIGEGLATSVSLRLGDSSPRPCLPADFAQEEFQRHREILGVEYDFFDGNLGSAGGHNRLAAGNKADMLLIQNPDVLIGPRALGGLLDCFRKAGVGMAEAKQLPIEHPKDYDPVTGECSWATTACAMIPAPLFRKIGGFDAESFFLYCDDVDYSWLTRLEGYSVIFQPAATAFHDKRLAADASWAPSASERYYSAEAALFLAHKWSRLDIVEECLSMFEASSNPDMLRAAKTFADRRANGSLPTPLDPGNQIGQFIDHKYAKHRFAL